MSGTLYLRLGDDRTEWVLRGPDAIRHQEQGGLEQAALHAAGHRVLVLVPSADVLLTEARLPSRQTRHLRKAVPFAIEEQLSDEVEQLHFALAPKRNPDGTQPVAVVNQARMQAWIGRVEAVGMHAGAMVPEVLALPLQENEWSLLVDQQGALLRTGLARGHALDPEALDLLLELAFEQAGENKPARLRLFSCGNASVAERARSACTTAQVEVVDGDCGEGALSVLASVRVNPAPIDLLQGEFSRKEHLSKLWRPWRTAAALFAVWFVLQFGLGIFHYVTLTRESAALQTEIEAVYRRAFPEARNVTNPRLQMEQHLAQLRGGGGGSFVPLMAKAAPVLHAEPGLELTALRYKDGDLEVELTVADFQAIDRLKQSLASKGLQVEVQNASARSGKTEGRLRLREGR